MFYYGEFIICTKVQCYICCISVGQELESSLAWQFWSTVSCSQVLAGAAVTQRLQWATGFAFKVVPSSGWSSECFMPWGGAQFLTMCAIFTGLLKYPHDVGTGSPRPIQEAKTEAIVLIQSGTCIWSVPPYSICRIGQSGFSEEEDHTDLVVTITSLIHSKLQIVIFQFCHSFFTWILSLVQC